MSNDRLEQQIAQLAEQQARLSEDVARMKEQMDYLSAMLVGLSERSDESEELDEETAVDVGQVLEQLNETVGQLTGMMSQVLQTTTGQSQHLTELFEDQVTTIGQFNRVYERMDTILRVFYEVLSHTGAPEAEDLEELAAAPEAEATQAAEGAAETETAES